MAENNKNRYNNIGKILAIIGTILLCFVGLWSAMNLQLKQMRENIDGNKTELTSHIELEGHLGMMKRIGADEKMYEEIETQFDWSNDVANLRISQIERLLQMLWRKVYNEDLPPSGYWPLQMDGR